GPSRPRPFRRRRFVGTTGRGRSDALSYTTSNLPADQWRRSNLSSTMNRHNVSVARSCNVMDGATQNGAMRDLDPVEVEDPTQPFSRAKIDSLRRKADGEWVEVSGRRFRVSLEALSHIGCNGTPEGMIGSADTAAVHGEIGGPPPELDE